ncbi:MAG: DUF488 family protein [Ignavibacteriae bacterium]|nr:MAG: DUF488 family protein [Ignavibacteriota bacterium]
MYYRRKVLLALLQTWGGILSNISFQKILFLFCQEQEKPSYTFVPYKYGCFSFQSYADRRALVYYNVLANDNSWHKIDNKDYYSELEMSDKKILYNLYDKYKNFSQKDLIQHVYIHYPYYATNSEILYDHLTETEINAVIKNKNLTSCSFLATIGYEGLSIDEYLNKLLCNNIEVIFDVRKNPVSMKFGFSKQILKKYLNKLDIAYIHIPQLGIESNKRKNLKCENDFHLLFKEYEEKVIPTNTQYINKIIEAFNKYNRIALMCFESYHLSCHRHKIIEAIVKLPSWSNKILHL